MSRYSETVDQGMDMLFWTFCLLPSCTGRGHIQTSMAEPCELNIWNLLGQIRFYELVPHSNKIISWFINHSNYIEYYQVGGVTNQHINIQGSHFCSVWRAWSWARWRAISSLTRSNLWTLDWRPLMTIRFWKCWMPLLMAIQMGKGWSNQLYKTINFSDFQVPKPQCLVGIRELMIVI